MWRLGKSCVKFNYKTSLSKENGVCEAVARGADKGIIRGIISRNTRGHI